jgi:8-oxo-dGTP pyrophosphatase MutT (NUDIX family)
MVMGVERPYKLRVDNIDCKMTCGIVLMYQHRVLVVREKYSKLFGFPKGKRQMFASDRRWCESPFGAAKRELKEETGIDLDAFPHKVHYRIRKAYRRDNPNYLYLWIVELMQAPTNIHSVLQKDHLEIDVQCWVPVHLLKQSYYCPANKNRVFNDSITHFFRYFWKYEQKIVHPNPSLR